MALKILLLTHAFYPNVGGIEVNSELLAEAFSEAGHQVRVVTWTEDPSERLFSFSIIRKPGIIDLFQQFFWADVIFENNPCLRLAWPNAIFRRPTVIALNTWLARIDGRIGFQDKVKKIWLKKANKVISVSSAVKQRCWPDAVVIGNPYRSNQFKNCHIQRTRDFVFLGRLVSDKGAEHAILAIHKLLMIQPIPGQKNFKATSLTIIGDGPEMDTLKKLVANLKMEHHVSFTGILKGVELTHQLNQHHFLLVPSLWEEPFGNVALEGMACGCIPIVSDGGGLPEAVGDAGLVFKRGDVDAMVNSIQMIYNDLPRRQALLNNSKSHLQKHLPQEVTQQYLRTIEGAAKPTSLA